jgi:DNA primase
MRYELTETLSEIMGVDIPERGVNAQLLCPFHDEDSPSFAVHLDTGLWQCFGCGMKGNLESLARRLGGELDDETRQDILIRSLDFDPPRRSNFAPLVNGYIQALQGELGQRALRVYLESRPISPDFASHFGVGFKESSSSLAFPYWSDNTVSGIKFRDKDGHKFATDNSVFALYNVDELRGKPVVILGEGESDTHALWSAYRLEDGGIPRHVGIGGTSGAVESDRLWSLFALDLLFARKIIIAYDADDAGLRGFKVAERHLGSKVMLMQPTMGNDWTDAILAGEDVVGRIRKLMA